MLSFMMINIQCLKNNNKLTKDMQYINYHDLLADYTYVELDNKLTLNNFINHFYLEKNSILIEPYVIKLVNTSFQKFHFLKMTDLIIFNNFEVMFDMSLLSKNIFGLLDQERYNNVSKVLDKLRLRFGQNSENCRFIFSNNIEGMNNINLSNTSVNTFTQISNINPYLSLIMNIFCFSTIDKAIVFHSNLMKMFNNFIGSIESNHLFYFNKNKMNNLKVIFRNLKINSNLAAESSVNNFNENDYGLNQPNPYSNISNLNIQYAYLMFSNDGVLFTDSPGQNLKNVLYSFNYESIKDCLVEMTPKQKVLPHDLLSSQANKCCIKMKIDVKDVYDNILNICSYKSSLYQCNLEAKYIQETLTNKCSKKLLFNISYAFDNNFNIRDYITSFSGSFSQEYIFRTVHDFIVAKLRNNKFLPGEKQMLVENKLTRMIQDLGLNFQNFIKENSSNMMIGVSNIPVIKANVVFDPLSHINSAPFSLNNPILDPHDQIGQVENLDVIHSDENPLPQIISRSYLPLPGSTLVKQSILSNNPVLKSNIFKLCENHPKMKACICAAFPLSTICSKNYCLNHPNFYECSPAYCLTRPDDFEACKCKIKPYDLSCKCRLNPLRKECFCLKFPESSFCLPDFCKNADNSNQIYCMCQRNPFAPECKPAYCHDNKYDSRCKCLLKSEDKTCKCMIKPSRENCRKEDASDFEEGVSFMKEFHNQDKEEDLEILDESESHENLKNPSARKINLNKFQKNLKNQECLNEDIFCLCKKHPNYRDCVCLAHPGAEICDDSFCEDKNNFNNYECDPNTNCKAGFITSSLNQSCKCKENFNSKCKCKLDPFSHECFCKKFPFSHMCNLNNCSFETNSLFCKCRRDKNNYQNLEDEECESGYCHRNSNSVLCECLLNPLNSHCRCLNDPSKCSSKIIF
jgi:hypothetical protein